MRCSPRWPRVTLLHGKATFSTPPSLMDTVLPLSALRLKLLWEFFERLLREHVPCHWDEHRRAEHRAMCIGNVCFRGPHQPRGGFGHLSHLGLCGGCEVASGHGFSSYFATSRCCHDSSSAFEAPPHLLLCSIYSSLLPTVRTVLYSCWELEDSFCIRDVLQI